MNTWLDDPYRCVVGGTLMMGVVGLALWAGITGLGQIV